jgi:hypothetical protein
MAFEKSCAGLGAGEFTPEASSNLGGEAVLSDAAALVAHNLIENDHEIRRGDVSKPIVSA